MLSRQIRQWVVAFGLVAAAGITGASASSSAGGLHRAARLVASPPVVSGELGEIVVRAPHDLGEVVVRAPHELNDVLVQVRPLPASGQYLAQVVVTARPFVGGFDRAEPGVALAAVR